MFSQTPLTLEAKNLKAYYTTDSQDLNSTEIITSDIMQENVQDGRAHVWTPVTSRSRMPSSAWKKKQTKKQTII